MNRFRFTAILISSAIWCAIESDALTLEALLQRTIDNNPEIQKAKHDLDRASGTRLVFRAVGLPNATIGVAGGFQGGARSDDDDDRPFGFAYGILGQPLFNAIVSPSRRRGDTEVLIAQQQLNVAVIQQLHAARVAFYSALYNRSLNIVLEEQRRRLEENMSSQKARYEAGLVDRGMFVSAEIQTRELDPRIGAAQRAHNGALLKLAEAMGTDLGPVANLVEPEGELKYEPIDVDLESEISTASERRADLKLARLLVRSANEEERIMAASYYPAINAAVGGEYIPVSDVRRRSEGSPRRSDDIISSEIRAGTAFTWRVIDNGKVSGAVTKQRSAREINEVLLHKLETGVPRELSRIRNDLEAIATKQKSLQTASVAAVQNAATIQQNLTEGVVSQLEFRLAENTLLDAKSGLLSLAYQQNVALAEWDRATGRYFQFSEQRNVH